MFDTNQTGPGRMLAAISIAVITPLVAACVTTLHLGPGAVRGDGPGETAVAANAGVEVVVSANAWSGVPRSLDGWVTPLLITLTNDGAREVELRYDHFALVSPGGATYEALPPFRVSGVSHTPVEAHAAPHGFGVAPYLGPWYPRWTRWDGPFPYHRAYYWDTWSTWNTWTTMARVGLPTADMIQKALPEGVLAPGGRITGFVYFEEPRDVVRLDFTMRLIDAVTGAPFGALEIPFLVESKR
jgi:hypothetical protein